MFHARTFNGTTPSKYMYRKLNAYAYIYLLCMVRKDEKLFAIGNFIHNGHIEIVTLVWTIFFYQIALHWCSYTTFFLNPIERIWRLSVEILYKHWLWITMESSLCVEVWSYKHQIHTVHNQVTHYWTFRGHMKNENFFMIATPFVQ